MAFPVKDWRDNDPSTDWDAEAAIDLETRLSGYTDSQIAVIKETGLNPDDYGARGDGASPNEDTAGWVETVNRLPTFDGRKNGRILVHPGRRYKINAGGLLNLDDAAGVVIEGAGGMSDNAGRPMIEWLGGADSGPMIRAASGAVELSRIALVYSNAAYDGDLIALGHSARAVDPFYFTARKCYLAGISGASGGRSLVNLDRAVSAVLSGNEWIDAQVGIRGIDTTYANGVTIDQRNTFNRFSVASIYNPGENWTIIGNVFEPAADGAPRGIRGNVADGGGTIALGLAIIGNWWGDITNTAAPQGSWIDVCARGLMICGQAFKIEVATGGIAHRVMTLRNVIGGSIVANRFIAGSATIVGIDYQQRSGQNCDGIGVRDNQFSSINQVVNEANLTSGEYADNVGLTDKKIGRPVAMPTYTIATLPAAASFTGHMVYVSDGAAGAKLRYSDGSTWVSAG